MSRLDRFLVTMGLIDRWNIMGQWIGDRDISDHCPIWILRSTKEWGPKPFRFINGWQDHMDFKSFVQTYWAEFDVKSNKAKSLKRNLSS